MTVKEALAQLEVNRDLANFNPMTGEEEPLNEYCRKSVEALDMAIKVLEQQPCEGTLISAQPEKLTDKEQRIFLAAMGREEKVCKQVDDECRDCCDPYEDSLVRICREIVRKIKGALWT